METVDLVRGDVYILANYLETQLTNIRKGDTADIKIDAFPGVVPYEGLETLPPAVRKPRFCLLTTRRGISPSCSEYQ
jgi:multidrug resistance efflux pump